MLDCPFRVTIGAYWILLPGHAHISAEIAKPSPGAYQSSFTNWVVSLGRFRLGIHLDPIHGLDHLKSFIDYSTKQNVTPHEFTVNGVFGVTHGGYEPPRTRIDWWFKKGDIMICLCLQSLAFPLTKPTEAEIAEHQAIIGSIKYCRDFPSDLPPQ